ncbi:unnamed protein product, partial [Brassicogethes aeneus]
PILIKFYSVTDLQPSSSFFEKNPIPSTSKSALELIKDNVNSIGKSSKTGTTCCCNPQLLYNIQSLLLEINSKVGKCGAEYRKEEKINILEKSKVNFPITTKENLEVFDNFLSDSENYSA